jgi:translation initiation factor 3 subunit D
VLLKDPNKPIVRLYAVPLTTFEDAEDENNEDDEIKVFFFFFNKI